MADLSEANVVDAVKNLDADKRRVVAGVALANISPEAQQAAIDHAGLDLAPPDSRTTNVLWIILVVAIALLALLAGVGIVFGIGTDTTENQFTVVSVPL